MPFKNLSSSRQVNQLDAEVRSIAHLANPELVAVLSADPVRVAIHQASGGNPKTTNLTLTQGDEIALLSRDVVLVRSGDAVWAVLNIAHSPKMDQVARDIRALCMRPTGSTALAFGWDGSATELTLSKNDVEARTFQMRGDVRAADMTATDTYVVVDKGDGGELRVHPGGTPEPGANWRATLPREAASFDRLRSAPKLSVVYKRGSADVCVVTASGGRLAAKMVRLAESPIDMAVYETSMFAIFPSGRAALYNADALAGAGTGALDPTASISVNARGELRTVTAAGKGSPQLWIGTSAGDVLNVPLVRQSSIPSL
ncbi:MAG TPA: hypothetical protein VE093_31535 [Polyangiaceae bacterium]|jgi:hypothetical protein|nr:hypothetical protein [Polyangiaceae bacterium]